MVTNSFQEWGLPIWDFFCPPARSGTGTPRMVMGIGVFAFPWVTGAPACHLNFGQETKILPYGNGDSQIPISEWGLLVSIRGLKWHRSLFRYGDYQGLLYRNGDSQIPIWKRGLPASIQGLKKHWFPFQYGDYQGLPYRNGDWHIPIWKWNLTITIWGSKTDQSPYQYGDYRTIMDIRSFTRTGKSLTRSWEEFVTIWGVG